MAKITEEIKAMVKGQPAFVATASPDGTPSLAPKGSVRILDEEHIIFSESSGKHPYENLKQNPKAAIAMGDMSKMQCLRFSGPVELVTEGEIYDQMKERMAKMGGPAPHAVVKMKVEEIYDCGVPGFGKKIA